MKSLKTLFIVSLLIFPFFNGINASSNTHTEELVEGWQELIEYCDTVEWGKDSESYQKISTNVNQRLASLESKTEKLTVNECLQAYNLIETDPTTKRKPLDIIISRDICHSCQNAMAIFDSHKTDLLILRDKLEAGDKTCAEISKDVTLREKLREKRVRRHSHTNKTLRNTTELTEEEKKEIEAFANKIKSNK